jgi:endonuclease G
MNAIPSLFGFVSSAIPAFNLKTRSSLFCPSRRPLTWNVISSCGWSSSKRQILFLSVGLIGASLTTNPNGYLASISYRLKMPNWVAECLTPSDLHAKGSGVSRKRSSFKADPQVPENFRARLADYKAASGLGLNRGHLSAASHHRASQEKMDESFLLSSNIVPQSRVMNGGDWLRLERLHQALVTTAGDCLLYILQGPLWIPRKDEESGQMKLECFAIGPNQLLVPTHIFKAAKLISGGVESSAAFLMPNKPLHTNDDLFYKVVMTRCIIRRG